MASFTITIPNTVLAETVDALAVDWNSGMSVTKTEFAKAKIRDFIKGEVYKKRVDTTRGAITDDTNITVT